MLGMVHNLYYDHTNTIALNQQVLSTKQNYSVTINANDFDFEEKFML